MAERHEAADGRPSDSGTFSARQLRPGLIQLAVWLGLIAWAAEYAILSFRKFVLHERAVWYVESMWLAAIVYVVVFALLGIVFAGVARIGPRARRLAICGLAGLGALSVLLVFPGIHRLASLVLAAGIGYQVGTLIDRRQAGATRLLRRTFAPLAGATAVIVVVLSTFQPIWEWRAYATLPGADPDAPNVILVILDTVRARELGLYGYDRGTTPELDAFAARGVTFDRAISTASWTLPSHFSMLTGLYPHEMPDDLDDMNEPFVGADRLHLSEVLRARGYATAGFVANMSYTTDETGLDRGFIHWSDHVVSLGQIGISTAPGRTLLNNGRLRRMLDWHDFPIRKHASRVNRALLKWLDDRGDRPFFVLVNYFDAHNPYLPPRRIEDRFVDRRPTARMDYHAHHVGWWDKRGHSPDEFLSQQQAYDGAIAWLDEELGRLFDGMEGRGLLDNTIVVVTADHGEGFGEHGSLGHRIGQVYMELIRVPLVILSPDSPAGLRVSDEVSLVDLPATILDLAGVEDHPIPGYSLARAWADPDSQLRRSPRLFHDDTGPAKGGTLVEGWHYIRTIDGSEELYDTHKDPVELDDLSSDPAFAGRLAQMRLAMDSVLAITPEQRTGVSADYATGSSRRDVALSKK
jgi:arylsulfatase A-like enzyme